MKVQCSLSLVVTLFILLGRAQQPIHINGVQDGLYEAGEYIVDSIVTILPGKRMEFAPGAIVRFDRFAGIQVSGTLVCNGSARRPVILTSKNDAARSASIPAPFDWNGVVLEHPYAAFIMKRGRISYSSVGVLSRYATASVAVDSVTFHDNGTSDITLLDTTIILESRAPFSFSTIDDSADVTRDPVVLQPQPPSIGVRRDPVTLLRAGGIVAGIAGAALIIIGEVAARSYHERYVNASHTADADRWQEKRDAMVVLRTVGYPVAALGAGSIGVSFVIELKRIRDMQKLPDIRRPAGVTR